jgi:hypothetical protein
MNKFSDHFSFLREKIYIEIKNLRLKIIIFLKFLKFYKLF